MFKTIQFIAIVGLLIGTAPAQDKAPAASQQQPQVGQSASSSAQPGNGANAASSKNQPPGNAVNNLLPKWLRINATVRGRWEDGITSMPGNVADGYYLDRMRLDVLVRPTNWVTFFGQGQDARVWGYDKGQPAGTMQDPIDLRQAYVQVGGGESSGPSIRFGRQELVYGNSRIFGNGDWSNSGREFDAVRARYYRSGANLEFVAGSVVLQDPNRFDRHKPGEHFYGTYDTFDKIVPAASVEPYFFAKTSVGVIGELGSHGDATEYVGGLRFAGKLPAGVDYSLEALHEGGSYAGDRISALGSVYTLGWTITQSHWKPRISADYDYASGDSNPKDGVHGTFDQLYGNPQPFFSVTGLFGWKNMRDTREGVDFAPFKHVKVFVDYRDFNLATVKDGLYNGQGTRVFLNAKATSSHVGEGIDARVAIEWPKAFTTSFGVGTLFSGDYLAQLKQQSTYVYPYFTWVKRL